MASLVERGVLQGRDGRRREKSLAVDVEQDVRDADNSFWVVGCMGQGGLKVEAGGVCCSLG